MSAPPTGRGLLAGAARLGHYRYLELTCAAVLGRAAVAGTPRFAGFLSGAAGAHAWRAGLFEQCLPVSVGLPDAATLTVSPGAALDDALDALGNLGDLELVSALVTALYPAMLAAWQGDVAACSPVSDAPLRRVLRRASDDLAAVAAEGAALTPRTWSGPPPALAALANSDALFA